LNVNTSSLLFDEFVIVGQASEVLQMTLFTWNYLCDHFFLQRLFNSVSVLVMTSPKSSFSV